MSHEHPPQPLLDRRSEPESRAVLEDWLRERGRSLLDVLLIGGYGNSDGDGDGDGGYGDGGDGGYGGYGDGGDGGDGGYGYGDGGGGYGDGDSGDGGYGDGGYGNRNHETHSPKESEMKTGLQIICTPGGAYNYVRVGWLRRRQGDEWELVGARVIRRFGARQSLAGLAKNGPAADTELLEASAVPPDVHRLHVIREEKCNPAKWAKHVPKPKDWTDEE